MPQSPRNIQRNPDNGRSEKWNTLSLGNQVTNSVATGESLLSCSKESRFAAPETEMSGIGPGHETNFHPTSLWSTVQEDSNLFQIIQPHPSRTRWFRLIAINRFACCRCQTSLPLHLLARVVRLSSGTYIHTYRPVRSSKTLGAGFKQFIASLHSIHSVALLFLYYTRFNPS